MKLIDANALIIHIVKKYGLTEIILDIDEAPTVETESNVQCKDCRYWKEASGCLENYKRCICLDRDTNAYFYCAWGEKKRGKK